MADSKFDLNKLKDNVGGLVGSLKSMINPAGSTPNVDPDDALGLKIAKITVLIKQMSEAQHEHVKNLNQCNELLNGAFHDIEALRNSIKAQKPATAAPIEVAANKPAEEEKKSS